MPTPSPLDVLIVSESPLYPADRGDRVQGMNLARALSRHGLKVGVSTVHAPTAPVPGWMQALLLDWPRPMPSDIKRFGLGWAGRLMNLRDRLAGNAGLCANPFAGILPLVEKTRPRAVISVGRHGPVLLRGLAWVYPALPRVWYTDQEPAAAELSLLKQDGITALGRRGKQAALHALMQACFNRGNIAHRTSAIAAPSTGEARWLGWMGGTQATTIHSGVDTDYFQPSDIMRTPRSTVMLGNFASDAAVHAACWFGKKVWPHAVYRWPDATWTILGHSPRPEVRELAELPGVDLIADAHDIRPHVWPHAAVVVPARCGRGVSHTLLEAAAMAMPLITSRRAQRGLDFGGQPAPLLTCKGASSWVETLGKVWDSPARARALGMRARAWVQERHTWDATALQMNALLQRLSPDDEIYPAWQDTPSTPEVPAATSRRAA